MINKIENEIKNYFSKHEDLNFNFINFKFSSFDKIQWWKSGEWVDEPDEIFFSYKDINCKVIRIAEKEPYSKELFIFGGYFCGYVQVPESHKYFNKNYSEIEIDCHRDLSYSEMDEKKWWIGFDCAHSTDIIPSYEAFKMENKKLKKCYDENKKFLDSLGLKDCCAFNPTYKNIYFCIDECLSIVDQLKNEN